MTKVQVAYLLLAIAGLLLTGYHNDLRQQAWIYVVPALTTVLAFACTLFLLMRDRHLQAEKHAENPSAK